MVRFLRLSAVLPSGAFQTPLVGAFFCPCLASQKGPPLCRSPIWSFSNSASWCLFLSLPCFSERSASLPFSHLSIFSDSVESLLPAKAIRNFQQLLHLTRCVATAFRFVLRALGIKVMDVNSYCKSMRACFERKVRIYQKIFFIFSPK